MDLPPLRFFMGRIPPAASLLNPYLPSLADSLPFPDHLQALDSGMLAMLELSTPLI